MFAIEKKIMYYCSLFYLHTSFQKNNNLKHYVKWSAAQGYARSSECLGEKKNTEMLQAV
jgi:hypothetical protein